MIQAPVSYKRYRFPPAVIAHAVWLYVRFPLSLRLVEEMLLERGIVVSYETIRCWARKFGPDYAGRFRRKSPRTSDVWHLDEVVVTIGGRKHWLWRAVDQDGYVLDEIVQSRRNTKAAKRLLIRLMKKQGCLPKRIVTDKLRSYGAARRQVMPVVEHRSHKGLNNRAENSHLRKRERVMQGFDRQADCNASCPSSRRSEISSFRLTQNAQLSPSIYIASGPYRIGRPLQAWPSDPSASVQNTLRRINLTSPPKPL
ncbi:transposase [Rhizobium leguminosarum bv. trifolii WSM2012]|nr:transposase [Rhizobium leguminosarum bv. trifolii WSM2012]